MFKMVEEAGIEAEQVTQAILFFAFYCALMHALPMVNAPIRATTVQICANLNTRGGGIKLQAPLLLY